MRFTETNFGRFTQKRLAADQLILARKDINAYILTIFMHAEERILKELFCLKRKPAIFQQVDVF